ncbi:hypothetical protein CEE69_19190 [Rhodopirellula bahusiensis]|uniref:Uncharacterized protein n=1 Tax=Rhodopirellula bahusiensis TaxID=2014065 RepID=A0A2G1W3T6_9BACT|nr:hypothetical protein CEE69_19190 [Rhodopirellula bahusiensis]
MKTRGWQLSPLRGCSITPETQPVAERRKPKALGFQPKVTRQRHASLESRSDDSWLPPQYRTLGASSHDELPSPSKWKPEACSSAFHRLGLRRCSYANSD